jgi:serine/threonine-protein kinase
MGEAITATTAALPRIFGRYLLIHRLSRGGMGEIFLARYGLAGFEKTAVIKKVLPDLAADEEFIGRFVTEAQVAVKLQHANIAQVFEVGRVGDEYFLALEHVDGRDLRRTLSLLGERGRRMPPALALLIGREVASGLAYAHRRTDDDGRQLELVHCDISPPNVMMSFDGEVKIIDFGIAKSALLARDCESRLGFGKFGYMAPEQLIRGRDVEARTDVYALGAVLFEMLTGDRLYEAGETPDYRELARTVARGLHPLPSDHDRALAPFDELVRTALRPEPADRYATAADFRDAMQRQLVAINPTICSDELGGFMRVLFSDDVIRQQHEIERLDKTRLEDWASHEAMETISFALGGGLDGGGAGRPAGATSPSTAPAPPPPPASAPALADRTALMTEAPSPPPRRRSPGRSRLSLIAAGILAISAAALAWRIAGPGDEAVATRAGGGFAEGDRAAPAPATALDAGGPPVVVALDPAPSPAAPDGEAGGEDAEPEPAAEADEAAATPARREPARRGPPARRSERSKPPERESATRSPPALQERVTAKFQRASREYRRFKSEFGPRFETEWNDLATFATFATSATKLEQLEGKIDSFRGRIRRARSL